MPGLISHYICGETVLGKLDEKRRFEIEKHRQLYNIGTQGPDIFFYYLPTLFRKNIKNIGSIMHKTNVGEYMEQMITLCECLENNMNAISYICGYLTHYCLDCNAHPYIYYKTGFDTNEKVKKHKALKHSMYHRNFETAIDVCLLKIINSEKPSDRKLWQLIKINRKESNIVAKIIKDALFNTYKISISEKQIYNAMSHMVILTRFLQSKTGKRKKLMGFIEDKTIGERLCSSLIHMQEINDGIDYLNINKKIWHKPWDNSKDIDLTFMDLFFISVEESVSMINGIFDFKEKKISKNELISMIGSRSLLSGIHTEEEIIFKYFDLVY